MTDTQENHLSMYIKVDTFLGNNAAALAGVTQIAGLKTDLETLIDNITTSAGLVTDDTTGYAIDKTNKREELEAIMLKVSRATAAYYISIDNAQGFKTADYTPSQLHAVRDSELYSRAKRLFNVATPISASLVGFNSSAADVADLDTKKEAFFEVLEAPRSKRGEKSAAVKDLEIYFEDGSSLLFFLDAYMDTFAAVNTNLYNQYLSARAIDDLGGGGGSGEDIIETVQDNIAAAAISAPIAIPPNTQTVRMTVTANGPLEFGKSLNGATHNGNTTAMSAPATTTYAIADFASAGTVMLVKNQSATLAGAYKIEFIA